jgi:SAM-dependent methyltransferase
MVSMKNKDRGPARSCSDDPTQPIGFRVVEDPTYGYRRLDPIPREEEVTDFYESRYYDLVRKGNRAPDLRRLAEGGDPASRELQWRREGLYTDIVNVLERVAGGRRLLEVGCGTGDFLSFAVEHGFSVVGTEPSAEAAQRAASTHLTVHDMTLEKFVARYPTERFDVIVMLNVLEHVPDAVRTLRECKQILNPGGIICLRVPNDFSDIQVAAREKLGVNPWWIAVPDHINYFNFASLRQLLDRLGFETVHEQGDFPMEMFLLMGENYVGNPQVGSSCHARRVNFDLGMRPELRQKIYAALASAGVGRDCLVFGKKLPS